MPPPIRKSIMNKDSNKNLKGQQFVPYFKELKKKYPTLSHLDILIYGEIYYKNNLKDGCFASNDFFAQEFNESILTIKRSIARLVEVGLVSRVITSGSRRRLYIIEEGITNDMGGITNDMQGITNDMVGITNDMVEENNKENKEYNNKNNNYNNINITKNLDFFEELDGVANITSTNTPQGGDNIVPGNDDGVDVSSLLKEVIEIPIEEKLKLSSTKKEKINESSTNEEGYKDISTKFTDDEQSDALNY